MTPILPDFDQAIFEPVVSIENPYFPLLLGGILSYETEEEDHGDLKTEADSFPSESNQVIVIIIDRATLAKKQGSSIAEIT